MSFLARSDAVYAMSNLQAEDTGLKGLIVYVSVGEVNGKKIKHGPRVKISTTASSQFVASVSIGDKPEIVAGALSAAKFRLVKKFILQNKDTLLKYWNSQISTKQMILSIQAI